MLITWRPSSAGPMPACGWRPWRCDWRQWSGKLMNHIVSTGNETPMWYTNASKYSFYLNLVHPNTLSSVTGLLITDICMQHISTYGFVWFPYARLLVDLVKLLGGRLGWLWGCDGKGDGPVMGPKQFPVQFMSSTFSTLFFAWFHSIGLKNPPSTTSFTWKLGRCSNFKPSWPKTFLGWANVLRGWRLNSGEEQMEMA